MFLYIFRHGESTDNREHIFSGWRDPQLSTKGVIDAQELAELLKDKDFGTIYTPELIRNVKTVEEIIKYHPAVEVVYDNRIRERSYGDLQGQTHLGLMKQDLNTYLSYHRSYETPPPGGESIAEVEKRVLPFCEALVQRIKRDNINAALCGGNNALRAVRRYFENLTVEQMLKIENPFDSYCSYEIK